MWIPTWISQRSASVGRRGPCRRISAERYQHVRDVPRSIEFRPSPARNKYLPRRNYNNLDNVHKSKQETGSRTI